MASVNERIKNRRISLGLSVDQVAEKLGKNRATVYRYENEDISKLPADILEPLASVLLTTPAYLMGWTDEPLARGIHAPAPVITDDTVLLPVIGELAAGFDNLAFEDWQGESVEIPRNYLKGHKKEDFIVLSVKGDSMFPTYQQGDKVLILRQPDIPFSGAVGAVRYSDDLATLKIVEKRTDDKGDEYIRLRPINPQYPPQDIRGEDLDHYGVIGVPKLLIREIEE